MRIFSILRKIFPIVNNKNTDEKIRRQVNIKKWKTKCQIYPQILFQPFLKSYLKTADSNPDSYVLYYINNTASSWALWDDVNQKGLYFDAPYGFILIENSPIALLTFEISNEAVFVKQIQGVKGKQKELQKLRWEKMLLKITIDWARRVGYSTVNVQAGKKHRWYRGNLAESFKMHYDVTAQRCGLKPSEDGSYYFIKLKS